MKSAVALIHDFCSLSGTSLPFPPTYFFRLCFGAGLNHWNFTLLPYTLLNTLYFFYRKKHHEKNYYLIDNCTGWINLAPQAWNRGYKETLGCCGYQSRTARYIYNCTAGLDCFSKQNLRHMFLLGFEWLVVTLKMHWIRWLQVKNDPGKRPNWV